MNRRTFLQAVSLAVTAAMVPAVAEAQAPPPSFAKRLSHYLKVAQAIVEKYPSLSFVEHDGLGPFLRWADGDYYITLDNGLGRFTFVTVRRERLLYPERAWAARPASITPAAAHEASLHAWSAEVNAACEGLEERIVLENKAAYFDVGDEVRLSSGLTAKAVWVNRKSGSVEFAICA